MKTIILTVLSSVILTSAYAENPIAAVEESNKKLWIASLQLKATMLNESYEDIICSTSEKYYKEAIVDEKNTDLLVTASFLLSECLLERAKSVGALIR